jgi:endonuclease YncB( thermonuclease family)
VREDVTASQARRRRAGVGLVVLVALIAVQLPTSAPASLKKPPKVSARVISVLTGDRIVVEVKGRQRVVQMIGADAPEAGECGWAESVSWLRTAEGVEPGAEVLLKHDRFRPNKDAHGHLLRYLDRNGSDVSENHIGSGWARVWDLSLHFNHFDQYWFSQELAMEAEGGIWGLCGGDFHKPL